MKTYFARHNWELDLDEGTRRMLWDSCRIAIHFPDDKRGARDEDSSSINPDDYDRSGRNAIRALVELARDGGFVCAEHLGQDDVQVGRIEPGSKIELINGKWGRLNGREGRTAILKSLRLVDVKYVKPFEYAVIFVGRPRRGTLMRWHTCGSLIKDLIENRVTTPELASLSPDQQEILCSEFLRTPEASALGLPVLANLILPVGRTMKDLDIIGLATDGKSIYAQVTYFDLSQSSFKMKRLKQYDDKSKSYLILFCNCDDMFSQDGIIVVPLRKVYELFTKTENGSMWLSLASKIAV